LDSLFKIYDEAENDDYTAFDCYSFVIPKTKPKENKEDNCDCGEDNYDYVFPSVVKVFKRDEKGWILTSTKNIKNFEELGRLKLNTIFHI